MKKCLYILVLYLAILSQPLLAQETIQSDVPVKFDEFGQLPSERLYQHLSQFSSHLRKNSQQSGQFLIYTPKNYPFGFGYRMAARYKYYLEETEGFSTDKITFTQCEAEKDYHVEQYIIPQNINNKTCLERVLPPDQTVLFDRISEEGCYGPSEAGCFYEGEIKVSLKLLSKHLLQNPKSKVYLFISPEKSLWLIKNGITKNPPLRLIYNSTNEKLEKSKRYLIQAGIKPKRIVTKIGNAQSEPYADFIWEIWIVPKNGKIPVELRLKRKSNRLSKGK